MLRIFYRTLRMIDLEERQRFEKGVFIEAIDPSPEEIHRLHHELAIDPGLLADALDPFEVPRLETEGEVTYVFMRYPIKDETERTIRTIPYLIAIGPEFVALISAWPLPFIDALRNIAEAYTTQKTKLILQLLRKTNEAYHTLLLEINRQINSLRSGAKREEINNKEIMHFVTFEEVLNDFMNALTPYSTILTKLLGGKVLSLYDEDRDLVEDLALSTTELVQLAKANLRTSMNIRDAYSTVLTNNLNRTIKLFTSLAIILTVSVIIPSIYGMNIILPLQDSPHAFYWLMGIMALLSALLLLLFSRKKWL